ncbi:hypothetical protein M434DRAFT_29730 [Hypoxylon sp. CO27-5]|nr:hypothetical protein M434DRAFT_29730 [Hypoxylon sp. CO27-5]
MAEYTMSRAGSHYNQRGGWLLGVLVLPFSKLCDIPEDTPVHHSSARLYEKEQEIYAKILGDNLASQGISVPVPEDVYKSPVWDDGRPINHPLRWSCDVPFTEIDAIAFGDEEKFTYHHYMEQLKSKFNRDHLWFRYVVKSFWGPSVDCIFELSVTNRPFIQIAFKISREQVMNKGGYVHAVEMFAYIMGRLCPIQGVGPLTGIFGFNFVDNQGFRISNFERMDRINPKHPADISEAALVASDDKEMESQHKLQDKSQKLVIYHVLKPGMNRVIEIF